MKRTYLARRNALVTSTTMSVGAYALILAVLLAVFRLGFPNAFITTMAPIFRFSEQAAEGSRGFFGSFAHTASVLGENDRLREQNAALAAENQAMRVELSALERLERKSGSQAVAVLSRPPVTSYDVLLVEGGRDRNITLGLEAFGPGGVPLGVVVDVLDRVSHVRLFSSPGARVSGWVGNGIPIEIVGEGGGALRAIVAKTAGIVEGDVVYAPGPGQLPLGQVARVDSDPALSGATLHIKSAVNLFSLSMIELRDTGVPLTVPVATTTP